MNNIVLMLNTPSKWVNGFFGPSETSEHEKRVEADRAAMITAIGHEAIAQVSSTSAKPATGIVAKIVTAQQAVADFNQETSKLDRLTREKQECKDKIEEQEKLIAQKTKEKEDKTALIKNRKAALSSVFLFLSDEARSDKKIAIATYEKEIQALDAEITKARAILVGSPTAPGLFSERDTIDAELKPLSKPKTLLKDLTEALDKALKEKADAEAVKKKLDVELGKAKQDRENSNIVGTSRALAAITVVGAILGAVKFGAMPLLAHKFSK